MLNPAAWSNPLDGRWGTSAPYYNDFRYERRPAESMSFGRIFRFKESIALTVRMNFQNIFNRTQLSNPTASNPLAPVTCTGGTGAVCTNPATAGKLTGGFGFLNYVGGSTFLPPRQGTLEMRLLYPRAAAGSLISDAPGTQFWMLSSFSTLSRLRRVSRACSRASASVSILKSWEQADVSSGKAAEGEKN